MGPFTRLAAGLRALLRKDRVERDLDDELGGFLQASIDEKIRAGASPGEARRLARIEMGSVPAVKDHVRDVGWESIVETTWQDLRYGARMLRRSPGFAVVAIGTLALAIGANTAIFSLVNTLLLRDLPVREPSRLVEFLWTYPGDPPMNFFGTDSYENYRDRSSVFSEVVGVHPMQLRASARERTSLRCDYVTGNFFDALGVRAAAGRLLNASDARPSAPPAAVVSWAYWTERFNRSPDILNSRVDVNGVSATIVGVAPRDFTGLIVGYSTDAWMTAVWLPADRPKAFMMLARLKDGVSLAQARAESRVLDRPRIEGFARTDPQWRRVTLDLVAARAGLQTPLHQQFGNLLWVLLAIVGALLLLACANIGSMLLARAAARQREIAVRVSLGAGRLRILRQVLTESLLLALVGAAAGIAGARVGAAVLLGIITSGTRSFAPPPRIDIALDTHVLLFTTAVAVVAAVLFGVAPAWTALASTPAADLRASATIGPPRSRRVFGNGLVVAQVAVSVVLLTVSDLYIGHLARLRDRSLGFDRSSVLLASVDATRGGRTRDRSRQLYAEMLERLGAIPGVRSATLSGMTPISGAAGSRFVTVEGFVEPPQARKRVPINTIAPNYFATFGTPVIAGRDFRAADADGPPVAIVNQAMMRHYFGARDPIGTHLRFDEETQPYEIVGVVGDAKYSNVRIPAPATIYVQFFRQPSSGVLALRTSVPPASIAGDVRRAIDDVMQDTPGTKLTTLAEQVDASIVPERLIATLSGFFGGLAIALAAIGLYGLLAYSVTRRTTEIGVRMALGASERDVLAMVLRGALGLVMAGLIVGAPIAFWGKRLAASMLENLAPGSVVPVVVAAVVTIGVALLAAYLPARRATRVQPVDALRHA